MARAIKIPPVAESEIQRNGMAWLDAQGCDVHRRNTGGAYNPQGRYVQYSEPGASDTWIIDGRGIHGEIEWKRFGKRPTLAQVEWLIGRNGRGLAYAFWADNLDTLERVARHVWAGGRIVYSDEARRYKVEGGHAWGPCGNYDLCR